MSEKVKAVPGRWATGPETTLTSSMIKVHILVDVGNCIISRRSEGEGAVDPLPLYEIVEQSPAYDDVVEQPQ
jgi:hypothetical protein